MVEEEKEQRINREKGFCEIRAEEASKNSTEEKGSTGVRKGGWRNEGD